MAECNIGGVSQMKFIDFSSPDFDIEEVKSQLTDVGVAVLSNVIPLPDCDKYTAQIKEWLDEFGTGFPSNINSIIHKYSISHIEPVWRVRLQAKPVFSAVWGTDKLLSSTDGIAVGRPPEEGGIHFGSQVPRDGLHFDQGAKRKDLHAYQGAIYLEEALMDDWCFAVMTQSNHHHTEFFQTFRGGRSEFRKLNKEEIEWLEERGCNIIRVPVPKGGLVLWDSRTVHAGAPPMFGRSHPSRWRYVVFVCQTPAIWATADDIKVKKTAYSELLCSRHWASQGVGNFNTRNSCHDITQLPDIAKTDETRKLAGVLEYDFGDGESNGPIWKPRWT